MNRSTILTYKRRIRGGGGGGGGLHWVTNQRIHQPTGQPTEWPVPDSPKDTKGTGLRPRASGGLAPLGGPCVSGHLKVSK